MLEMEHGKNYDTYFFDSQVKCFYARKLYWKHIDGFNLESKDGIRLADTFLIDDDEVYRYYEKNRENAYPKEETNFEKTKIKVEFFKYAVCCPCCHKVHRIEDFLTIKDNRKDAIKEIEERCGKDWYCLFDYESNIIKEEYFEGKSTDTSAKPFTLYTGCEKYNGKCNYFIPNLTCPECGADIRDYEFEVLDIFNKIHNAKPRAFTIFKDKNKIALSILYRSYYINPEAFKIAIEDFRVRLTFNTVTGNTYFIGPKKLNGKKMSGWYYYSLLNVTYRYHYGMPKIVDNIINSGIVKKKLLFALMEKNGHTIERFNELPKIKKEAAGYDLIDDEIVPYYDNLELEDEISYESIPLTFLTLYNRLPNFSCKHLMQLLIKADSSSNYYMKDLFKNIKRDTVDIEALMTLCKNIKMPTTKKTKKMISEDIGIVRDMMVIRYFGFKDINVIYNYLSLPDKVRNDFANYYSYTTPEKKNLKVFIKDMIKHKGEPKTLKTLFSDDYFSHYLYDSAKMYSDFKNQGMVIKEYFTDNIKKIHDRLSLDYPKIQYANVNIPYKESAKRYNMMVNGFTFNLAKDTNELIKIGQDLKICVGGYREQAINSTSIIISMKDDKDNYVGCIELTKDFRRLVQAKAVCNNLLQEHKAEALREWVQTFDIDASNCYDYEHILNNQIEYDESNVYSRSYDYHNLELDEEGNVKNRY